MRSLLLALTFALMSMTTTDAAQVAFLDGSTEQQPEPVKSAGVPMHISKAAPVQPQGMKAAPAVESQTVDDSLVQQLHADDVKMEEVAAGAAKIAADSKKVENEAWNGEHVKTSLGEAASTATTIKKAIDALDQDAKKLNIYHSEMDINSHSDIKIEAKAMDLTKKMAADYSQLKKNTNNPREEEQYAATLEHEALEVAKINGQAALDSEKAESQ